VEICKLRLFLKLVAQVEPGQKIEALPDIDFNIRAGNTLVGFVTKDDVRKAIELAQHNQQNIVFGEQQKVLEEIEEQAENADRCFKQFQDMQTKYGMDHSKFLEAKAELRSRLKKLEKQLNDYLAREYGKNPKKETEYDKWLSTHKPFHWFIEFYRIMKRGGFDVIIGNPPFLELKDINYSIRTSLTKETGAVHAMCVERSMQLLDRRGGISMIFPMSLVSTQRMTAVQKILEKGRMTWYSNFAWRPAKLFDQVNRAITFFVSLPCDKSCVFSTCYQKWTADVREFLIYGLQFRAVPVNRPSFWVPKFRDDIEHAILEKCIKLTSTVSKYIRDSKHRIYYRTTGGLYWKVFTDFSPAFRVNGKKGHSTRETWFSVNEENLVKKMIAILSSNLFWWWYTITSNLRDLNPSDIYNFPIPDTALRDPKLWQLGKEYIEDLQAHSTMHVRFQKQTGKTETQLFKVQNSKPIIDEIDCVLAQHYGFTDEELDFIINYDIKYRMGRDAGSTDDEKGEG
jgi:hypothetical protein